MPPAWCAPCIRVYAVVYTPDPCCTWPPQATVSLRFRSWGHVLQHSPRAPDASILQKEVCGRHSICPLFNTEVGYRRRENLGWDNFLRIFRL